MKRRVTSLLAGLLAMCTVSAIADEAPNQPSASNAAGIRFFETQIRPLLAEHCYKCHGAEEQESGLRLDTFAGLMSGGDSGPAIVGNEPAQSLIVAATSYKNEELQMPPDGKLSDQEIAAIVRWIAMGAPHPNAGAQSIAPRSAIDLEEGRKFWAFQTPRAAAIPKVQNGSWPKAPIDYFVLANLESHGLAPSMPADRRTLIRRATFDLIGLPPTGDEIEAFLADESPEAYAKVIDRLLASPRYGERWGRHWLDVARYADSNGLDENIAHGNAWRYRDYVVAAFNSDKPYDQFLTEQLAGDLLDNSDDMSTKYERLIATGFLSLGPKVLAEVDETKMEMDIIDEQIDTIGRSLMGLTLGCARCHDHKFDPIGTSDYYALAGIFKSTRTMEHYTKIARWWENPIPTEDESIAQHAHERQLAQLQSQIDKVVARANDELAKKLGAGAALPKEPESQYPAETKAELKKLRQELTELEEAAPEISTAMGVGERETADVRVHLRGSHLTQGELTPRRFPLVMADDIQQPFPNDRSGRLRLANWLTSNDHPLTSRVMVNRVWRWHFGEGLVRTPDNFGRLGEEPVNGPLLDWLAVWFQEEGWSIKSSHRLIMLSATYQMQSGFDAPSAAVDPENRLQWRANIRRLEAEAIRDSLLAVSQRLDGEMGGSLVHVKNREFFFNHTSQDTTTYDSRRRSLYLPVVRNHLYDVFQLFDYSDAGVANGNRTTSTVAPQALFMMNSDFVIEVTSTLAERLLDRRTESDTERVEVLYEIGYGRLPTPAEQTRAESFLRRAEAALGREIEDVTERRHEAWRMLCQAIVSSNEFVYVR